MLQLVHEARGVRAFEGGATTAEQTQIRAQLFGQAALGRFVAHRHRPLEMHQPAVVDACAGGIAVDQRRQHGQGRANLAEIQHHAGEDAARDTRQSARAHVHHHAATQVGQDARRHLAKLGSPIEMNDGQFLQKTAAQIQLAVAGDLVGHHHHPHAGHGGDTRVAAKNDRDPVLMIGDHRVRQHLFLGHGHLPPVEKNQPAAQQDTNERVQFGGRQGGARGGFEQPIRLQVTLLDLQTAGVGRPRQQRRQGSLERRLAAVGAHDESAQGQPALDLGEVVGHTRPQLGRALHRLGSACATVLGLAERNGRGRQVLARPQTARAIAIPFVLAGIKHHLCRHRPALGAHAQDDFLVALRFHRHCPRPHQIHARRPHPSLGGAAKRGNELGDFRGHVAG